MSTTIRAAYRVSNKTLPLRMFTPNPTAGNGVSQYDTTEYTAVDLMTLLYNNRDTAFLLEVNGDSMSGAGIGDGDFISVDYNAEARNGDIVVASINGEVLVKRLTYEHGITYLSSENCRYEKIEVIESDALNIIAVVTGCVKLFSRSKCKRL